jgi:hypothetical protein
MRGHARFFAFFAVLSILTLRSLRFFALRIPCAKTQRTAKNAKKCIRLWLRYGRLSLYQT